MARTLLEAVLAKASPNSATGCWEWTGYKDPAGYGEVWTRDRGVKRKWRASRASWTAHRGAIPIGLYVCHRCDNPSCVNPSHLFLGTQKDNVQDSVSKRRRAYGERNNQAKLTREKAEAIKSDGRPQRKIARDYGVSQMVVWQIKNGKTWQKLHYTETGK